MKYPGSSKVKSQSIILFSIPKRAIAGLMVDAGEYLPCAALSKNGLSSSFIRKLNSFCVIPLAILFTENDGELKYVTMAPVFISTATTAPLLLLSCSYATF